jgi:peptidoglycan/xylan/chitin deacetylase (PgdA/CDA1 family)
MRPKKFACLTYHALARGHTAPRYIVSEERFRAQLQFLASERYAVDGFEQLERRLHSMQPLPERYVVLTVDDGEDSSLQIADLLAELGFNATFFLTRNRALRVRGYIREPEIRELRTRGFSLGTHGATHHGLTFMDEEHRLAELRGSKGWLEDVLGEKVTYMSAPGGYADRNTITLARQQGYVLVANSNEWMNSLETVPLHGEVNRVCIRRNFSVTDLSRILEGDLSFYLWRQARTAALALPKKVLHG